MLKKKILIKNKRLKPDVEKIELELFQQGQFVLDDADEPKEDASAAPPPDKAAIAEAPSPEIVPGAAAEGEGAEVPINYTGSTTNVHPWLSSMINYAQPIKFQGFDVAESKCTKVLFLTFLNLRFVNLSRKKHSPQHVFVC